MLTNDSSVTPAAREAIFSALDKVAKPLTEAAGNALLGKLLTTLLDSSERPETRFAIVQLLKNEGFLPAKTSLANLPQMLTSLICEQECIQQEVFKPAH